MSHDVIPFTGLKAILRISPFHDSHLRVAVLFSACFSSCALLTIDNVILLWTVNHVAMRQDGSPLIRRLPSDEFILGRQAMGSNNSCATIYEGTIPTFVEPALEQLYENVFSSLGFLDLYSQTDRMSTYVAHNDGRPSAVFLFRRIGRELRVFNEGLQLDAAEVDRFARDMFARFPDIGTIAFNAVRSGLLRLSRPCQQFACSEDIVVPLPATIDDYHGQLGKSTRKNIKRYLGKLKREFPEMQHEIFMRDAAAESDIRAILSLNRARMAAKAKVSAYDEEETRRLIRLVQKCGLVSVLRLNGKLCAGEIATRVGSRYFAHVGGHDERFDAYRLGTLSCYLAICECIRQGGKAFHFLWGQYAYKYMLAGVQQELSHLRIYRSRLHVWMNGNRTLPIAINAGIRRIKCALRKSPTAQIALHTLSNLRLG
jgi:hypothetical protein